ncbi:MAG TPA: [acyl-carrier-protein] S-malonyltransferase [Firmicutes bacterium]|nr:[acyl-carrier-protein] S-malonyltransferase [Bacillota bacterium]
MKKIIFLFPGQGSQKVGMGIDFVENFPAAKIIFEKSSYRLKKDILELCATGPEEALKDTRNTQPSIVTVSSAIFEVVRNEFNIIPDGVAGHSVGEYSALYAAGVLAFEDTVFLVNKRAEFMQDSADAFGEGGMAAVIGMDDEKVIEICEKFGDKKVQAANFNSPGQVVISGEKNAITKIIPVLKENGARMVKELAVSGPWHSKYMEQAKTNLAGVVDEFKFNNPVCDYFPNVTANRERVGDEIKRLLIEQLTMPVLWTESMTNAAKLGYDLFVELGPGKVLTGLLKRINPEIQSFNIETIQDLEQFKGLL